MLEIWLPLIGGLVLLIAGGELLVRGAVQVATGLGVSPLVIGLTLVGFGTSTPELVTSVQAALSDAPGIAYGNIVGSNIANILLIAGIAALRCGVLGMGVVDVEAGTIPQDHVDQARLVLAGGGRFVPEAAGVAPGRLLLVGPLDPIGGAGVGVDDEARRHHRVEFGLMPYRDAELGLGPEDRGDLRLTHRYWPVVTASMERLAAPPSIRVRT